MSTSEEKPSISVCVRIRKELGAESTGQFRTIVRAADEKVVCFDPADHGRPDKVSGVPNYLRRAQDLQYSFTHVFDQYATQEEVYRKTAKPLITGILSGYNATVFAYGATGEDKCTRLLLIIDRCWKDVHYDRKHGRRTWSDGANNERIILVNGRRKARKAVQIQNIVPRSLQRNDSRSLSCELQAAEFTGRSLIHVFLVVCSQPALFL